MGEGERSSAESQAHHVGISPQEDRGGAAGKVGEVEGKKESRLDGKKDKSEQTGGDMGVAIAGLVLTALALLVSLGFNYLQYRWRNQGRAQDEQERTEAKAEQLRKERMPPEFFNLGGTPNPLRITGSQHSVQGPFVDVWGLMTVVNPTPSPMNITPQRLVINGAEWAVMRFAFHARDDPSKRRDRITLVGNAKQDCELHFLFPEGKCPTGMSGDLSFTSDNREDEPFSIPVSFA